MDMATIEDSRRPAEYKVDRTFYIAIFIVLTAIFPIRIKCILRAKETTILEISTIGTYETGHCLPYRTGRIHKRNILSIKIRSINIAGRRTGGPFFFAKAVFLLRIIIIRKHCPVLTYQRNIDLTFRYHNLLLIHAFTHQYRSTDILAEIRNSINSLLHGKEISATILRHYKIIVSNILSQFRYFLGNGIHGQTSHNTPAINIQMSVIFTSLRHRGNLIGRYPHK